MDHRFTTKKYVIPAIIGAVLFGVAVWAAIGYVVTHFVTKYW